MKTDQARRVRQDIIVLSHQGLDWATLALRAGSLLRSVVPFEHACWHSVDPGTHLLTGAVKEHLADDPRHVRYEFSVEDVNKFSFLARSPCPVGLLSQATHGHSAQSPRFRDLLQPIGIAWELRACFVAGGTPWGACGIYRTPDQPDFAAREAAFVADVSRLLAEGFRRAMLLGGDTAEPTPDGPGVIILDDRDTAVSITPAARRWLQELVDIGDPLDRRLPSPVYAVAARARGLAATGVGEGRLQARARAFTRGGQWLLLHGSRLDGLAAGMTAVVVEPARPAEIALLVVQAYGLSEREREITGLTLRGLSTKEMASQLHLSPLTVQHYLKAIFEKLGVRSRGELIAKVFCTGRAPADELVLPG
ncbi:MAG: helix-turn-helix transcriptional regulator [Thermomicrobia bacterium]|nr:helix-turn-helix transcriptional regulator [Thermomicrobia bacterium]